LLTVPLVENNGLLIIYQINSIFNYLLTAMELSVSKEQNISGQIIKKYAP